MVTVVWAGAGIIALWFLATIYLVAQMKNGF